MAIITNPIYVGIGPFPQIIPEEEWIAAVAKLIQDQGAETVLRSILGQLKATFPNERR